MFGPEVTGVLFADMQGFGIFAVEGLFLGIGKRLGEQFSAEKAAVDEALGKSGEHFVAAADPRLDGAEHVIIVQQGIAVQRFAMNGKIRKRDVIIQEIMKRRGAK